MTPMHQRALCARRGSACLRRARLLGLCAWLGSGGSRPNCSWLVGPRIRCRAASGPRARLSPRPVRRSRSTRLFASLRPVGCRRRMCRAAFHRRTRLSPLRHWPGMIELHFAAGGLVVDRELQGVAVAVAHVGSSLRQSFAPLGVVDLGRSCRVARRRGPGRRGCRRCTGNRSRRSPSAGSRSS